LQTARTADECNARPAPIPVPGQSDTDADEVAKVLWRDSSRAGRKAVAVGLRRGDLLPGLGKVIRRWLVPMTALADWIDGLAESDEVPGFQISGRPGSAVHGRKGSASRARFTSPWAGAQQGQRGATEMRAAHFFSAVRAVLEAQALAG